MNSILLNIKDPGWWFTAVVIGMIVSVAAGFAKDWIGSGVSRISRTYRERRERRLLIQKARIDFYSDHKELLNLAFIRAAMALVFGFAMMGFTILQPMFHILVKSNPELDAILNGPLALSGGAVGIASWGLFMLSMVAYWKMARYAKFASSVYEEFKKKNYPEILKGA